MNRPKTAAAARALGMPMVPLPMTIRAVPVQISLAGRFRSPADPESRRIVEASEPTPR